MKGRFLIHVFFGFYLMVSCDEPKVNHVVTEVPVKEIELSDSLKVIEFYKGSLPCSDCNGILQQLWLMRKEIKDTNGLYLLREIFSDGNPEHDQVINTRGLWNRRRNAVGGDTALILELCGDSSTGFEKRFYEMSTNGVAVLDGKLRKSKRKQYTLNKEPW